MSNYFIKRTDEGYPYNFFTEAAFHEGQVMNMIMQAYEHLTPKEEVLSPKVLMYREPSLTLMGQIGRIVKLNENYEDLFFDYEMNDKVRELSELYNGDLIKVKDALAARNVAFSLSLTEDLLEEDIRTCLERHNVFYLDHEEPYQYLQYGEERSILYLSHCLKNIPIKRVW